jgi:hypothetical protein
MIAGDCSTLLRQALSDMNPSGRWTEPTLLNFIDRGNKRVVRDVLFPDSRLTLTTTTNPVTGYYPQEFQLPQIILILRVYVNGQLCVPTDINTLEGHQIGLYQQDPSAQAPYSGTGGPPGATGPYNADWYTTTPLSYPVANGWQGYPAPDAQPFFAGQRPRYYLRGGNIGFVPAPGNVSVITIDCIAVPNTISVASGGDNTVMTTPDMFMDAIVWAACTYAQFADDQERNAAMREVAEKTYQLRKSDLMKFQKMYVGDILGGPKPRTYRSSWKHFRMRRNG